MSVNSVLVLALSLSLSLLDVTFPVPLEPSVLYHYHGNHHATYNYDHSYISDKGVDICVYIVMPDAYLLNI